MSVLKRALGNLVQEHAVVNRLEVQRRNRKAALVPQGCGVDALARVQPPDGVPDRPRRGKPEQCDKYGRRRKVKDMQRVDQRPRGAARRACGSRQSGEPLPLERRLLTDALRSRRRPRTHPQQVRVAAMLRASRKPGACAGAFGARCARSQGAVLSCHSGTRRHGHAAARPGAAACLCCLCALGSLVSCRYYISKVYQVIKMSDSVSGFKPGRQGSILPFLQHHADASTRYSAGQLRPDRPCVFCTYACTPRDPDSTSMADIEHRTLLDSVMAFYAQHATTTEPATLAQLCVELASRGRAEEGCEAVDDVIASIDAEMVMTHMTAHRCDRDGQIAMLRHALFTACAAERVLSQNLLVRGKHGKLQLDTTAAQQLRTISATMSMLTSALGKLNPA